MSTIADNFFKDGSFGRRLLALLASVYAIALLWGQRAGGEEARGYDVIASILRSLGLDGVADWIVERLMATVHSSPLTTVAAALVLAASVLSMTATYRRTVANVSPQSSFALLLALCLLIDTNRLTFFEAAIGTAVTAVLVGVFCLLPSDEQLTPAAAVGLLIVLGPAAAILYAPAKIISWFVTESLPQKVSVALERETGPVKVEIIDSTGPKGARLR